MALYLISYDIAEKDEFEYGPLWAKLKNIGAVKILYSEWLLVEGVNKSTAVYGEIAPLTQGKDRLLVQEVTADATWDKLMVSDAKFKELMRSARGQ
jgi:hypothetical protein